MAAPRLPREELLRVVALVREHGSVNKASAASGLSYSAFNRRYMTARAAGLAEGMVGTPNGTVITAPPKPFEIDPLPDEIPTASELLERRVKAFARKQRAKEARELIPVRVQLDGPFGIAHFGDPHVDDDGTDLALLQSHVAIVNRTEGLFAANCGDYTNNWIGRLARLYAEQSLSAKEAWVLCEWLIKSVRWMYLIGGNHDAWSGAGDPVSWMASQSAALYEMSGARLGLHLPNGRIIRVNARHDFHGRSQWNTAHGPAKAAQMGWRDHILTCGHTHTSGYQVLRDPSTGLISHALRIGSYKTYDRYAEEKGLPNQTIFVCPVTIVDPTRADDDPGLITTIFDPEHGADYLTWLRKKRLRKTA